MNGKLPYLNIWDVTPCSIAIEGGMSEDGEPLTLASWSGKVNYSEKAKRVQDKDGRWVQLAAVIHVKGDILPGVVFTGGKVTITGFPVRTITGYSRPRNPDGTVNHTRLELM